VFENLCLSPILSGLHLRNKQIVWTLKVFMPIQCDFYVTKKLKGSVSEIIIAGKLAVFV